MKIFFGLAAISSLLLAGCTQQPGAPSTPQNNDAAFKKLHDEYVVEFLRRNPAYRADWDLASAASPFPVDGGPARRWASSSIA